MRTKGSAAATVGVLSCPCLDCNETISVGDEDDEKLLNHDLTYLLTHHERPECSRRRSFVNCAPSDLVFRSHIQFNTFERDVKLPKNVKVYKNKARDKFSRYKKAECERRRRYARRRKMIFTNKFVKQTRESRRLQKKIDMALMNEGENCEKVERLLGKKARLLEESRYDAMLNEAVQDLTMRCETCKKLFLRVNLFWGISLCDSCYFDKTVLIHIMSDYEKYCKPKKSRFNQIGEKKIACDEDEEYTVDDAHVRLAADDPDDHDDRDDYDNDDSSEDRKKTKQDCEKILHHLCLVKNRRVEMSIDDDEVDEGFRRDDDHHDDTVAAAAGDDTAAAGDDTDDLDVDGSELSLPSFLDKGLEETEEFGEKKELYNVGEVETNFFSPNDLHLYFSDVSGMSDESDESDESDAEGYDQDLFEPF